MNIVHTVTCHFSKIYEMKTNQLIIRTSVKFETAPHYVPQKTGYLTIRG